MSYGSGLEYHFSSFIEADSLCSLICYNPASIRVCGIFRERIDCIIRKTIFPVKDVLIAIVDPLSDLSSSAVCYNGLNLCHIPSDHSYGINRIHIQVIGI